MTKEESTKVDVQGRFYGSIGDKVFDFCFVKPKKLRYKQMEIFHQCFQYTPSNLSDFI